MGLCKCPKKKVTNLFCYEHRVNVCQYCMVKQHSKCVVQSYLLWLQDSDYNPTCTLCGDQLDNEECIRLICLHIFHWRCLDRRCRRLPSTTAPAGYACPVCDEPIFPLVNMTVPVADQLRDKLATVNWARGALGLPSVSTENLDNDDSCSFLSNSHNVHDVRDSSSNGQKTESVLYLDEPIYSRPEETAQMPRRMMATLANVDVLVSQEDDKKDRRISRFFSISILHRYLCRRSGRLSFGRGKTIILCLATVILIIIAFSKFGRLATEDDPTFDPLRNPHVHLNNEQS